MEQAEILVSLFTKFGGRTATAHKGIVVPVRRLAKALHGEASVAVARVE